MGSAKAALVIEGEPCTARLARLLETVASEVIEVGPAWTTLRSILEEPAGSGPLAAVAAGCAALERAGLRGPAIVLACDLPLVTPELLELLATWPGDRSVLPIVAGRAQPLCARWSRSDLVAASGLVAAGERSLRLLPSRSDAVLLTEAAWATVVAARAFADVDSPDDLAQLGLEWHAGAIPPR